MSFTAPVIVIAAAIKYKTVTTTITASVSFTTTLSSHLVLLVKLIVAGSVAATPATAIEMNMMSAHISGLS